jgi:hypothetical protein
MEPDQPAVVLAQVEVMGLISRDCYCQYVCPYQEKLTQVMELRPQSEHLYFL